jgi:uncharacterized protein YkwD
MRAAGWLTGLITVAVVAGVLGAAHQAASTTIAAAANLKTAAFVRANEGTRADPPHVIPPPPPSPSPVPQPPPATSGGGGSAPPARPAPPSIVVNSTQQALINQDRAAHGLAPLTWSSCLSSVAVSNANRIAAQGYLSHTNGPQVDLTCHLGNRAGENIGYWSKGINDTQLNTMFMNSPEHYANIMGPYHYVATAWVVASNGYGYIAVEFG